MEDAVEVILAVCVHDIIRRERSALVHAHIERRILHVRKPALRRVELVRRHAEIEQHAIHGRHAELVEDLRKVPEIVVHDVDAACKTREAFFRRRDGLLVLIDADEAAARGKEGRDAR